MGTKLSVQSSRIQSRTAKTVSSSNGIEDKEDMNSSAMHHRNPTESKAGENRTLVGGVTNRGENMDTRAAVMVNRNTGVSSTTLESQTTGSETCYRYQPIYVMDYVNNVAVDGYQNDDTTGGLPLQTYDDDDDVFDRGTSLSNVGYIYGGPGAVGAYAAGAYAAGYGDGAGQAYYNIYYPAAMAAPQKDVMRYVECLQDGMLAVWGDEDSPDFNAQFSRSASIYCYTDAKDTSTVLANRMTPHVLVQTAAQHQNALVKDNDKTSTIHERPKKANNKDAKKSKSKEKKKGDNTLHKSSKSKTSTTSVKSPEGVVDTEPGATSRENNAASIDSQTLQASQDPQTKPAVEPSAKSETKPETRPDTQPESGQENRNDTSDNTRCASKTPEETGHNAVKAVTELEKVAATEDGVSMPPKTPGCHTGNDPETSDKTEIEHDKANDPTK